MLKIGSLFSGIGMLEFGLERATGARTEWQVEIEAFPRRVLAKHWPHALLYRDVSAFASLCERGGHTFHRRHHVDIICGGFPCQDISVAGKGAGLSGARSGLFFSFIRVVRVLRPRIVVMENSSALTARGLGTVLGELAACGYDAEWDCVPASAVGAPHQRDRIWITAYPVGSGGREQPERGQQQPPQRRDTDVIHLGAPGEASNADVLYEHLPQLARSPVSDAPWVGGHATDAPRAGLEGRRQGLPPFGAWCGWAPASAVRRVDDGGAEGLDRPRRRRPVSDKPRLKALGNAVVPQVAEIIGRRVAALLRGTP